MRFLLLLFLVSCATPKPKEQPIPQPSPKPHVSKCPDFIVVKPGAPAWNAYDEGMIKNMNDGCRRHYSPQHCAKKILKTSDKEYAITCGIRVGS